MKAPDRPELRNSGVSMEPENSIVSAGDLILVTGATGFIGRSVVQALLEQGFRNLRLIVRSSAGSALEEIISRYRKNARIEVCQCDLLSPEDCIAAAKDVAVVYHLAAGTGEKSFAYLFMNSVLTTRNLLEACVDHRCLKRFVNVSSFALYTNCNKPCGNVLDESCPIEDDPVLRGDPYCFAKLKQDEIVMEYGRKYAVPYVIVRPGVVYGPGKHGITGRVGIGTFGLFLHLGGSNQVPLTYVDNCADAIVLAGLSEGVVGEIFNVVDDDLPSSREFLQLYKNNVKRFRSLYIPRAISYLLCCIWEDYSHWSRGQLPPTFNRKAWHAYWKGSRYSNAKIRKLGWAPRLSTADGLRQYFESYRREQQHA
jgi:nucleoside-diphosphate-sugar epimerase